MHEYGTYYNAAGAGIKNATFEKKVTWSEYKLDIALVVISTSCHVSVRFMS